MIYDIIIDLLKHLLDTLDFLKPYATTVGVVFIILRQNNIRKVINGHLPKHFRDNRDYEIQEIKSDLKDIKNHFGIGVVPSNIQPNGQKTIPILSYKRFFLLLQAVKIQRRKKLMDKLKSRKFWLTILAALIPVINKEFNINLDLGSIVAIMTAIMSGVAALAHVDAKKVIASIAKTPPNVLIDMTFKEAIPIIQTVHNGINNLLKDAKLNDGSQAFKDAVQAYSIIMSIIEANKHPEPLPSVHDEQVSA
jgi:hypothetical protein